MGREIETKCIHLEEEENSIQPLWCDQLPNLSVSNIRTSTESDKDTGYDYSRLQNPTREHLEKTVASLEMESMHWHFHQEWQRSH